MKEVTCALRTFSTAAQKEPSTPMASGRLDIASFSLDLFSLYSFSLDSFSLDLFSFGSFSLISCLLFTCPIFTWLIFIHFLGGGEPSGQVLRPGTRGWLRGLHSGNMRHNMT